MPTDLKTIFDSFDIDKNGILCFSEVKLAIEKTKIVQPKDLLEFFKIQDKNGDGVIDYDEFVALVKCLDTR